MIVKLLCTSGWVKVAKAEFPVTIDRVFRFGALFQRKIGVAKSRIAPTIEKLR